MDFSFRPGESWTGFMRFLGMFSLLEHKDKVPSELYESLKMAFCNLPTTWCKKLLFKIARSEK